MIKLDKKYSGVLFVTIMVVIMSFVISLALQIVRTGFTGGFVVLWLRSWALSALVAWPSAMVAVPLARSIVAKVTR